MNRKFVTRLGAIVVMVLVVACASPAQDDSDHSGGDKVNGEIGEIGGMCGGIAGFQCNADGAYCRVEPGVCHEVADYAGICAPKPEMCTMEYAPVCGCDGQTYSNGCAAAAKGASVAYQGECENE